MNDKIKAILTYTGIIGAIISSVAYIVVTAVLVMGFSSRLESAQQLLFSVLGAVVGLMITISLRSQGVVFAKEKPDNKAVMKEYRAKLNKTKKIKKLRTITSYIVFHTIKDIFIKGITVAGSTFLLLYIFIEGNGDYSLFLLALSNILMFISFGLVAMTKAYDRYNEEHISAVKEIIIKLDQVGSIPLERNFYGNNLQHKILNNATTSGEEQIRH